MAYPGTPAHQALLEAVLSYYAGDPRILAITLFGSLVRGTWDMYSDLDLDIVTVDSVQIEPAPELARLCDSLASTGQSAALIIPTGEDEGDVVLDSLLEFSIRYHPLHATSPNIIDSLLVLAGQLDLATIRAAGEANRHVDMSAPSRMLDTCLRNALGVDIAIHRGRVWMAIDLLHRMRSLLMRLFAMTHGGPPIDRVFEAEADPALQASLGATLPDYSSASIQHALVVFLDFLEGDLHHLTNGQIRLTAAHRKIISQIRSRQNTLSM